LPGANRQPQQAADMDRTDDVVMLKQLRVMRGGVLKLGQVELPEGAACAQLQQVAGKVAKMITVVLELAAVLPILAGESRKVNRPPSPVYNFPSLTRRECSYDGLPEKKERAPQTLPACYRNGGAVGGNAPADPKLQLDKLRYFREDAVSEGHHPPGDSDAAVSGTASSSR